MVFLTQIKLPIHAKYESILHSEVVYYLQGSSAAVQSGAIDEKQRKIQRRSPQD